MPNNPHVQMLRSRKYILGKSPSSKPIPKETIGTGGAVIFVDLQSAVGAKCPDAGGRLNNVLPEVSLDSDTTNRGAGAHVGAGSLPAERHGQPQADLYASAGPGIIRLQL